MYFYEDDDLENKKNESVEESDENEVDETGEDETGELDDGDGDIGEDGEQGESSSDSGQSKGNQTKNNKDAKGDSGQSGGEPLDENKVKNDLEDINNKKSPDGNEQNNSGQDNSSKDGSNQKGSKQNNDTASDSTLQNRNNTNLGNGSQTGTSNANAVANAGGKEVAKETGKEAAKETGKAAAKEGAKASAKVAADAAATQGGAAAATAGLGATIGVVLFWVFIIILILIILIGFIFFFLAMPGQIMEKMKQLGQDVLNAFAALTNGAEDQVDTSQMAGVANYLESMGYDLKGEGFVSSSKENDKPSSGDIDDFVDNPENIYYDHEQDVWRDGDNGKVVDLNSDSILSYIVSDNLCYIIKNFNQNLEEASEDTGFWAWVGGLVAAAIAVILLPVSTIVGLVVVGVGSVLAFSLAGNPNWGTGLISIYHESGGIGEKGKPYNKQESGYIKLDTETKQLSIKRGRSNGVYTFDVDGWSGRYGMPLEFLLSVHIATHMPDLAIEMATAFETDVQVLLREVNDGTVESFYKTDNNTYISIFEFDTTSDEGIIELFKKGISFAEGCECSSDINPANVVEAEETTSEEDSTDTEETNGTTTTICSKCRGKIGKIVEALLEAASWAEDSYTPYISKVTDHWFRDVYFVIKNPSTTEVMQVDEDYFYETNERWTMYETYAEGDAIPEGFVVGDYKLYEYKDGEYTLSTKTKEEVEEINEKIAQGDTTVTKLVKKSISTMMTANDGSKWTAYKIESMQSSILELEITEESPDELQGFEGRIYYKEERPNDIVQVEDGQRGKTNEKIKKMFLNNRYYQYDGTIERAERIEEDRKKVGEQYKDGELKDVINTDKDPRNEELLGKVSIARDSLGAFSILENTHTLDADYIYRDFKELIVELDYFDKEDLSDKVAEVMQWPIPDCGSGGWPIRKYEKGETFYGTLINSKVDIELMRTADIEAAEKLLSELESEVEGEESSQPITPTGTVPSGSIGSLVAKGYEVHKVMEGNGWDYCVGHRRPCDCERAHCDHQYGNSCGLASTIQEAQSGYHNTCCATFVSWVLKEAGFDLSNHPGMHSAQSTYNWCEAEGWTPITDLSQMEPGDLLFNNGSSTSNIGHVQMLGNDGEWLNGGSVSAINDTPDAYDPTSFIIGMRSGLGGTVELFEGYEPEQDVVSPITGKVIDYGNVDRINEETGEMETVEYIKIEAIHNYLYDTESPKGEGYLECELIKDEQGTVDDEYDSFEDKASDEAKKLEGYDYFYEEYQGIIDGFVLYIEGFDLTLFDDDGAKAAIESNPDEAENYSKYEPNEVYNMTDNLKEAYSIWKEEAKTSAIPLITIGDDLYIKEGTIIGKTNKDPDMEGVNIVTKTDADGNESTSCTGNGNYIRLILRDLEDAIVEDVETYMIIDEGKKDMELDWEFFYWLPYESGPLDGTGNGPEACGTVSGPHEVAVGIAQWTSISGESWSNITDICKWLFETDPSFCKELEIFGTYSATQITSNLSDLHSAWTAVANKDRDRFLELQMEYFYENEFKTWVEDDGVQWLLEKSMVAQGTYASLKNWGPNLGWKDVINAGMTDEEICKALLTKALPIDSTCGTLEDRWESQYVLAVDIITGTYTEVEEWVRTKMPLDYNEGKNAGALAILELFNKDIYVDSQFIATMRRILT